ncbi:MAG: protein BatD [Clostridia bacterium]|nr:protein BatD [Clostridia bacterium]
MGEGATSLYVTSSLSWWAWIICILPLALLIFFYVKKRFKEKERRSSK